MYLFDSKYYALNKKLFMLCGNWPYQNRRVRVRIMILFLFVVFCIMFLQSAKLITTEYNITLIAEVLSNESLVLTSLAKQIMCLMKDKKVKNMIERMEYNWKFFNSAGEDKIIRETAEEGRRFTFLYMLCGYTTVSGIALIIATMPLIDIILSLNSSRPKMFFLPAKYFIDEEKYFYPITTHMYFTALVVMTPIITADSMFATLMFHAYGLFKLTSRRFEHAFDKYNREPECDKAKINGVTVNIAEAVKCHLNATKFVDDINDAFGIGFLVTVIPVVLTISMCLFCVALFLGNLDLMLKPLVTYIAIVFLVTILIYPAQKVLDYSSCISFKAYSAQWYAAPCKEQTLLLLIIQRGLKPSAIILGNICVLSRETYAWIIQTSMTYFTALLSLQ